MHKAYAGVELGIARQPFLQAWHPDQHQPEAIPIVEVAELLEPQQLQPIGLIHEQQLGTIAAAGRVDVRLAHGVGLGFVDQIGGRLDGTQKLLCELTVRVGKVVYDLNGLTRERWDKLPPNSRGSGDPRWDGLAPTGGAGGQRPVTKK